MSLPVGLPGGDLTFFGLVFLAVFAAIFALIYLLSGGAPRRRLVMRAMATRERFAPSAQNPSIAARQRINREFRPSRTEKFANRLVPKADWWRRELARAGTPMDVGSFAVLCVILALALSSVLNIAGVDWIYAVPGGLFLSVAVLHLYLRRLIRRRIAAFLKLLPDAIGLMVRGIKSGLPVSETILIASREIRDPLGEELRRIADQVQLGQPLEDAMAQAAVRIDLPEVAFMAVAFTVQRETGGNLAEMLENLDSILRRRRHMQLKVRAFSAEARASAIIIGALPFVLLALLSVMNMAYISVLFTTNLGHILLGGGMACITLGILSLVKLTRFQI